ncbi:tubulin folding cofactor D C terminal-domain-containing protein [Podospora aff. communis PSN243]|uniref:Tubulin folding cofactor D C terminal-domain-containing protein n=1 Tax=Podospora aff. communis PSN243 TaxID=3040156 RepID=A0AAV9GR40_9PEZI|nr:tubulin folding cofactor D C terminal-domain-containing protein [Podospora aff. communis PSN243]
MDAPEEDLDIKLQKISSDLLSDFSTALPSFLRKPDGTVRTRVRTRETHRLASSLLDPFQELPQLLDPHLSVWLPLLGDAFLEYHRLHQSQAAARQRRATMLGKGGGLLMPLSAAVARILYTLCKIRGEKVIVRFLSSETRCLEVLLSAVEEAERVEEMGWSWEERYVVLLWLSQLMLAPFDLASMSSNEFGVDGEEGGLPAMEGFEWPREGKLPGIAVRVVPLAVKYLGQPGKERDAAKALLVRISMRRDMQRLGVLDALVRWVLGALRPAREGEEGKTPYHYIGVLSFLSGILTSSADTSDMDRYLKTLFDAVHGASAEGGESGLPSVVSSALARKTVIKVIRAIAVLVLRNGQQDMASMGLVETTIGFLLESLADNDTPVRLAASKSLSVITFKLDAEMASQVVEAVLESLGKNVIWKKDPRDSTAPRTKDLSAVNPLEWHGLMLALSHLLYRRSPPAENLSDIIQALVMGLSFEQRNPSGGSIGANVRDASCFGIWALARRYTTKELLAVKTPKSLLAKYHDPSTSVLQALATELIVAACLDPSGNIRRGSSAALQELIGRHPDTVIKGIWVVQTVDYHAVALRSRALQEVALNATILSGGYGEAILDSLLGWRGNGDIDAASRRASGASYGAITAQLAKEAASPMARFTQSVSQVIDRIKSLQPRQVEERHGLLLNFASVLDSLPTILGTVSHEGDIVALTEFICLSVDGLEHILSECSAKTYRRPELIAEAASILIISSFPLLQAATLTANTTIYDPIATTLLPGPALISRSGADVSRLADALGPRPPSLERAITLLHATLPSWLLRPEEEVIPPASEAGLILLLFSTPQEREKIIREWAAAVRTRPSGRNSTAGGFFSALVTSYSIISTLDLQDTDKALICDAILKRWDTDKDTDMRVLMLRSLTESELMEDNVTVFLPLLEEGLDDYTTNARGDVGSLVRFRAVRATRGLWQAFIAKEEKEKLRLVSSLFLRVLRLAAEKLDRVRAEAQGALGAALSPSHAATLRTSTFSSKPYFGFLLDLLRTKQARLHPAMVEAVSDSAGTGIETGAGTGPPPPGSGQDDKWMDELMAGFVSSADTGNEDLVIATRAALCDFCALSEDNVDLVCSALVRNLKSRQGQDRVLVPTLEVVAFLFHVGVFVRCNAVDYKSLCLQVQKAGYKTGNVRKIEACIRVYGAIAALDVSEDGARAGKRAEAAAEARKRLGALAFHPWPRVRSMVVDEVWGLLMALGEEPAAERLKGVDWGVADKAAVKTLVQVVGLA